MMDTTGRGSPVDWAAFPVRDETWILDRVDGLGTGGNWRVVLRKADPTTTED